MYRKLILLTALVVMVLSTDLMADVPLKATPARDAMTMQLAMDEWDNRPGTKKETTDKVNPQVEIKGRKSIVRAAVYSALLPGAGEYYLGHRQKARVFFVAEALTWLGWGSFRLQGKWKKDDMIRYADTYAGTSLDGKDDEFLDMVGFYESLDQYNSLGRAWDPERPYYPDTPEYYWQWQSEEEQEAYRELKNDSGEAYRRARLMVGVAIVSRVISVIDTIRDGIRHNRKASSGFSQTDENRFDLEFHPLQSERLVSLTYYPSF